MLRPLPDLNVSAGGKIKVASADDILIDGAGLVSVIADDVVVAADASIKLVVQGEIADLDSRVEEAELLITEEAIVATVRSSIDYYNDLLAKVSTQAYDTKN